MSSIRTSSDDDRDDEVEYHDGRVVSHWRNPWCLAKHPNSSGAFGEKHGIYAWALPFKYHQDPNPYTAIKKVAEYLQDREQHRRQVSRSALATASEADRNVRGIEEIALIHGWWQGGSQSTSGEYYCNPEYPHNFRDDELMDCSSHPSPETIDQRTQIARFAASLGLSSAVLVRIFDVSAPRKVTDWCREYEISYSDLRREGVKKMARTWKTINHWGLTKTEIAQTFNLPRKTLGSRLKHVEDFDPPDEPSLPVYEDDDKVYTS